MADVLLLLLLAPCNGDGDGIAGRGEDGHVGRGEDGRTGGRGGHGIAGEVAVPG